MSDEEIIKILTPIIVLPDRKRAFLDLAKAYECNNEDFRLFVRKSWDFGVEWELPNIRYLASTTGENTDPETRIRASLLYFSIGEKDSVDRRDDTIAVAAKYHSCLAANLDAVTIFRSIANISIPKVRALLDEFILRPEDERGLNFFGLEKIVHSDGKTEIKRNW